MKRIALSVCTIFVMLLTLQISTGMESNMNEYSVSVIREAASLNFAIMAEEEFHDGLILVRNTGSHVARFGFADSNGELVTPLEFNRARRFSEGLAAVQQGNRWGFIDTSGEVVIPFEFSHVQNFSEGLAAVYVEGKWGFINTSGEVVVEPAFDGARSFRNGFAAVRVGGECVECVLQWFEPQPGDDLFADSFVCHSCGQNYNGVASGDWGFIDTSGTVTVPLEYSVATYFNESGLALVGSGGRFSTIERDFIIEYDMLLLPQWSLVNTSGEQAEVLSQQEGSDIWWQMDLAKGITIGNGLSVVGGSLLATNDMGVKTQNGDLIIPAEYTRVIYAGSSGNVSRFWLNRGGMNFSALGTVGGTWEFVTVTAPFMHLQITEINITENWIVITNPTGNVISARGLSLTNGTNSWRLPAVIVRPNTSIQVRGGSNSETAVLKHMTSAFDFAEGETYVLVGDDGNSLSTITA
jgi:hypothetical protein